jgi:hypothetical protein
MAKQVHQVMMGSIPRGQQNELQANLLKLLEACPFDETNPPGLPFISAEKDEANQAFAVVRYAN